MAALSTSKFVSFAIVGYIHYIIGYICVFLTIFTKKRTFYSTMTYHWVIHVYALVFTMDGSK